MRQRGSFAGGALVLVVRVTPSGAESAESILPLRLVGVGGLPLADGRHSQAEGLTTLHRKLGDLVFFWTCPSRVKSAS